MEVDNITAQIAAGQSLSAQVNIGTKSLTYIGVTKRGWRSRWCEHLNAAKAGSHYRFHEAIRRFLWQPKHDRMPSVGHELIASHLDLNTAMDLEERIVAQDSLYPSGLNMVPGGFAGIRHLGKHGFHVATQQIGNSWERRDLLLRRFSEYCRSTGSANPLAAARWLDDAYAERVICANPNNFDLSEIIEIRYLAALGHPSDFIASHLGCSERRVMRCLSGTTYARVARR
jgi:hypothetical protein